MSETWSRYSAKGDKDRAIQDFDQAIRLNPQHAPAFNNRGFAYDQIRQIVGLAAQRRLPAIYGVAENAEAGGLMVYGTNLRDLERRAATFVDKILKGAKPGDYRSSSRRNSS